MYGGVLPIVLQKVGSDVTNLPRNTPGTISATAASALLWGPIQPTGGLLPPSP